MKKSRVELYSWSSQSKAVSESQVNVKGKHVDNVFVNYICGIVKGKKVK